jgi:flagellar biosynthesis/type III secretory pathway protein FliH
MLEESWAYYHEIVEKGFIKGLNKDMEQGFKLGFEQGFKLGFEQGLKIGLEQQRYLLLSYVKIKFPDSLSTARRCAEAIKVSSELQQLMLQLFALTDTAKVEQCLLNLLQRKREE